MEINNTFYHLPDPETIELWRHTVDDNFRFAIKASRYITHMKKLKDGAQSSRKLYELIPTLGEKDGPVLFQLPPRWHRNAERLSSFLSDLDDDADCSGRKAFEFRDENWLARETYETLFDHGAAFCVSELGGFQTPKVTTTDFVYVRLHGPSDAYEGRYSKNTLSGWAGAFAFWARNGLDVYCYFDNDEAGYAAMNARELKEMV